jgi:hypothetical protein
MEEAKDCVFEGRGRGGKASRLRRPTSGVAFAPVPVQVLGGEAQLDDEVSREVLGPDLAPLLLPQADQRLLVLADDVAGVGAANEAVAKLVRFFAHN